MLVVAVVVTLDLVQVVEEVELLDLVDLVVVDLTLRVLVVLPILVVAEEELEEQTLYHQKMHLVGLELRLFVIRLLNYQIHLQKQLVVQYLTMPQLIK
tara:strand:+ start:98 stop:391 length:294 start_codon:yes stop_codon:yes gene_type:complete